MDPQAYILSTPLSDDGVGAAGMQNGVFKKLYEDDNFPLPIPVSEVPSEIEELTSTPPPEIVNINLNKMMFHEQNKVTIKPDWCFGKRGPLYLVACVVNTSTFYDQ